MNKKERAGKIAFKYGLLITDEPSLYRLNIIAAIMSGCADRDNWVDMWRKACELIKFYKGFYEKERKVTAENLQLRKRLRELTPAPKMCMSKLRDLIHDYDNEEISISKFLEEINNSYKGWIPALKDSDYDGTYLGYIEKVEECGAINHYQRTVFNRMNKWVLTEGETLLYYMELPASPTKKDDDVASDSGKEFIICSAIHFDDGKEYQITGRIQY